MQSTGRYRVRTTIIVIALVALFMPAATPSADAWAANGCKYAGTSPAITYGYSSLSTLWQNSFYSGQAAWDASSAPGYFTTTASPFKNIWVRDYSSSQTWWGLATGGCDSGGGQIWYGPLVNIYFNNRTADGLSTTERKLVAIHELGHAYGLAHSSLGCGVSFEPVMRSDPTWVGDNCGHWNAPYSNDVYGVSIIY